MTEIENSIIETMLTNITQNKNVGLKELAKQCHVADSTIVKLSKKLGYSGYIEMYYHYLNENNTETTKDVFNENLVVGDLNEVIHDFASVILEHSKDKNVISDGLKNPVLGLYLARKLRLFDIFAAYSYDYTLLDVTHFKPGMYVLIQKRTSNDIPLNEMLKIAIKKGYRIILITSEIDDFMYLDFVDMTIQIQKDSASSIDLWEPKVMVLLEKVFAEYSRLAHLGENKDE